MGTLLDVCELLMHSLVEVRETYQRLLGLLRFPTARRITFAAICRASLEGLVVVRG